MTLKVLYSVHLMAHDNQQILFYTRSNTILNLNTRLTRILKSKSKMKLLMAE